MLTNVLALGTGLRSAGLGGLLALLMLLVTVPAQTAGASVIVDYTFDGDTQVAASVASGVTASIFNSSDNSVSYAENPSSGMAITDAGWKRVGNPATPGNYFEFTVTPVAGYRFSLTGLTFDDAKDNSMGTTREALYRVGGSGPFTSIQSWGGLSTSFTTNSAGLSGISSLQNDTQATTIRLWVTDSNSATKLWYVDNVSLNGESQARASLSTTVSSVPAAKVFVGAEGVHYVVGTRNNVLPGGTVAAEELNYTLGFASQSGLSFATNGGSNIAGGASVNNIINVDTSTSGVKGGTLNVVSSNAWQTSLGSLSAVGVYQQASLTLTDGELVRIANAAADDGAGAQRASARLASLTKTGGDVDLNLTGLTGGGAGAGTVISAGSSVTGMATASANLLNGSYWATYEMVFEHDDQGISGASADDLDMYIETITKTITDNIGTQEATLLKGRNLVGLSGKSNRAKGSEASLLGGTMSDQRHLRMTWRDALEDEGPGGMDLLSDVVDLSGTNEDIFVLQLDYDPSALVQGSVPVLAWKNNNEWNNAICGNVGGTPTFAGNVAYDPDLHYTLGTYGVDEAHNTVWAVLNHNSEFAVVPEPATLSLLALGGLAILRRRK